MNTSCFTHKLNLTTEKRMPWYKSCWCPTQSQPWRRTAITLLKPSRYFIGLHSYVLYGKKISYLERGGINYLIANSTTIINEAVLENCRTRSGVQRIPLYSAKPICPVPVAKAPLSHKCSHTRNTASIPNVLFRCHGQQGESIREFGVQHSDLRVEDEKK